MDRHPLPGGGSVSVVVATGRIAAGGRDLDTRYEQIEVIAGRRHVLTRTGTSTFLVRRGPGDAPQSVERILIDGAETELRSVSLPGGDLLLYGSARVDGDREAAVARVSASGRVRWSWRSTHRPSSSCDPERRLCHFATANEPSVSGDSAWIDIGFYAGRLDLPGGHVVRNPRGVGGATVALDLRTGSTRWARGRPGQTARALRGDELVAAQDRGARLYLHHYDARTGRPLRRTEVSIPRDLAGMTLDVDAHPGGYLIHIHSRADQRQWLIGCDPHGAVRFHRPLSPFARWITDGRLVHFLEPIATQRTAGDLYANGLRVTSVDAAGREVRTHRHRGLWDLDSFRLGASGGLHLTGLLTDRGDSRFVAAPVAAPSLVSVAAPEESRPTATAQRHPADRLGF